MVSTLLPLMAGEKPEALPYLQSIVRLQLKTVDTLIYGRRLADPVVIGSPTQMVRWSHDRLGTASSTHTRPVVMASCWASATEPGKKLLLVSNTGPADVEVKIACPDLEPGAALAGIDGRSITYDPSSAIAVSAFSWRALQCGLVK